MRNSFSVSHTYPVHFTRALFSPANSLLAEEMARLSSESAPILPCLVVMDAGLVAAHPGLEQGIGAYIRANCPTIRLARDPLVFPGGEPAKDGMDTVWEMIDAGRRAGLCRQSFVWALGGGAFLDAAGLAAALLHRGIRLVRFPSTVLSQNDSGVGVKTGVTLDGVKNLVGTFAPPAAVFCDLDFLDTLPDRDWIAGSAEAFKVAVIKDAEFFHWLEAHAEKIPGRDPGVMEELVRRCAALHIEHIATSGDPFEFGSARPLDFGHWAAHTLESMSGFSLRHGEAVAVGIALDLLYASLAGLLSSNEVERVLAGMRRAGLPLWHDALAARDLDGKSYRILAGIEAFREHLGGELHVTFPGPLGCRVELTRIDRNLMTEALERLGQRGNR